MSGCFSLIQHTFKLVFHACMPHRETLALGGDSRSRTCFYSIEPSMKPVVFEWLVMKSSLASIVKTLLTAYHLECCMMLIIY